MKKGLKVGSFLLACSLVFTACGSTESVVSESVSQSTSTSVVASVSETRTVVGTDGVSVEIPQNVERVAASIGAFAQVTAMLGGEEKLVATTTGLSEMYEKVWPNVNPGDYDVSNVESIIASDAQVVYGPNVSEEMAQQLNQAGIAVVTIGAFSTADELKESVALIGEILGGDAPERAEKFNTYYDENISYVEELTSNIPEDEKVKVLNLRYSGDTYTTVNGSDISSFYAEAAGGVVVSSSYEKPEGQKSMVVNAEQIIEWAPDVIYTMTQEAREKIMSDPALTSVPAVANGKVYTEPTGTYPWSVRSAEGALMPLFLGEIMYPEIFTDLSLETKIKEFYQEFYDYTLTDEEVQEILAGQE